MQRGRNWSRARQPVKKLEPIVQSFLRILCRIEKLYYLGVSQKEPKFKIALLSVCVQSQVAVWASKRMRAFASLLVVSAHAHVRTSAHGKKWWIYLKRRP